jgi:hypothetical protein
MIDHARDPSDRSNPSRDDGPIMRIPVGRARSMPSATSAPRAGARRSLPEPLKLPELLELLENREIVTRPGELREPAARVAVRTVKRPFGGRQVPGRRFPLLATLRTEQPNTGLVHTLSESARMKSVTPSQSSRGPVPTSHETVDGSIR